LSVPGHHFQLDYLLRVPGIVRELLAAGRARMALTHKLSGGEPAGRVPGRHIVANIHDFYQDQSRSCWTHDRARAKRTLTLA